MQKSAALLAIAGAVVLAAPASAANLLTNGSFEDGLNGWIVDNGAGSGQQGYEPVRVISYNSGDAYGEPVSPDTLFNPAFYSEAGSKALYFVSDVGTQTISQSITITDAGYYTFGFSYYLPQNGLNNPNGASFTASVGGTVLDTFVAGVGNSAQTWYGFVGSSTFLVGDPGTFEFSFTASNFPAKDFVIDSVFLAKTTDVGLVPEPATWAMLISGFGMVGGAMRRRKANPLALSA